MTKNRKKAKKIQENVPPASAQHPEPENVSMSSGPVNNSMSDGESERFHEVASGVNKNKENVITSSEMLSKNTDELNKKPGPPESNTEDLSQLKNNCRALKAELNATKKKYEEEKQQKEKLYEENQEIKSKLSSLEKELQDLKMLIQRFEKESANHQKSSEEQVQMECEPTKCDWWEQQEPESSVDSTREGKEDSWGDNNAQGTLEKSWPNVEQDTEMTESFKKEQSGSDTRWRDKRGSDMGQQRNEWHQRKPRHINAEQPSPRNQEQHRGARNQGRGRGYDNRGEQSQNNRRGRGNRGHHGQNYNHNVNNRDRYDHRVRTTDQPPVVAEIVGDRFDAPTDCSVGHCVADNMPMGSEIMVTFSEAKKDSWNEDNAQGTRETSWSNAEEDTEMTESINEEQSGFSKGSDQYKDGNSYKADGKQLNVAAAPWPADTEAWSSSQSSKSNYVPATPGSDTRRPKRRGGDMGQQRNEWHQRQLPHRNAEQQPHRNEEQAHGPRNWGRGREFDNRGDQGQNYRRGREDRGDQGQNHRGEWEDRGDHGQNYNHIENNRDGYDRRVRTTDESPVVTEIFGDLFNAPTDCSLAHCVAEDMRMGSGIAVTFRQKFKRVDELLDQRKRQGNVAVLEEEGRYIYYLVTKRESTGKPTMETLERSLKAMREHIVQNQVKKIAMPRIGCGLDRLDWHKVKILIHKIFSDAGAQITIYNYNEDMAAESSKPKPTSSIRIQTAEKPVAEIEPLTAILCLCAEDGSVDSTLELLDRKFRIMGEYQKMDRKLGNILPITKQNYLILLLIVKEKKVSLLSFEALGKCMRQATKLIDKQEYYYVAVESVDDPGDPFLFDRVITVIKNCLDTKWKKELWLCYPKT